MATPPSNNVKNLRVLMLVSDGHGGTGGIAQYNRDVLEAYSRVESISEVRVVSRNPGAHLLVFPPKVRYVLPGGNIPCFTLIAIADATLRSRPNLIHCAHINFIPVARAIKALTGAPILLSVHGTDAWIRPVRRLTLRSLESVNYIASVSQITLDRIGCWCDLTRVPHGLIPNTVSIERFRPGARNRELANSLGLSDRKIVMTLGRMDSRERAKGFDELIELMPRLKAERRDIALLLAGDGDDRPRLQVKARELGLQNDVVFTGFVPEPLKADYFRLADAFVMASRWEGFGIVLLEALACGVPVVGSTLDGTREALLEGELGVVVDPRDPDALARAILSAVDRVKVVPPGLERYTFPHFIEGWQSVVQQIVQLRGRRTGRR